jgi:hypothetical protein
MRIRQPDFLQNKFERSHREAPKFPNKDGDTQGICTEFAQNKPRTADLRVRFPVTIRHRTSRAKIYAPGGKFAYYRLAYSTAGKRRMQTFTTYSDAREAAERVVRELANGSQAAALTATQSRDALVAFLQGLAHIVETLQMRFFQLVARREWVAVVGAMIEMRENLKINLPLGACCEQLSTNVCDELSDDFHD